MELTLFMHEWAVWFSFQSDSDSKNNYQDNFMQAYAVRSPHDLGYLWHAAHLGNLEHFLLQPNNMHHAYAPTQTASKCRRAAGGESTRWSFSRRASSPSGRIPRMKLEEGSSSPSIRPLITRTNCTGT